MARMACAMMLTGLLTGGVSANVIQFAVDGVPIGAGEVIEVAPSDVLTVGIYIAPDQPISTFDVAMVFTGPWPEPPLPQIGGTGPDAGALLESGDVWLLGDWDLSYQYNALNAGAFYYALYEEYIIGAFLPSDLFEPQSEPGVVAEFDLHVPDVPISTVLGCEFTFGEVSWLVPGGIDADDDPDLLPLVLHVIPEPVSLGLLVLGGVVALRRRVT